MSYDAFLLASFGGPEGHDDVMPFLENVTRGRGVPRERLLEVSHHYHELGGVSPINDQNRALIDALRPAFDERGLDLPIYWGNRFWDPFLVDAVRALHADGHRRVLMLVTSAYSSYSGCRAYREDLATAIVAAGLEGRLEVDRVGQYFDHPGFVEPFAEGLRDALRDLARQQIAPEATRVLFVTHSIPDAMAAASGPPGRFDERGAYVAQHLATARLVLDRAGGGDGAMPDWELVYQSRSGPPQVPWLEPDINDALRTLPDQGVSHVVVVPIGFVSDHVEVIWDLDHEAQETCGELGLTMARVATPGTDPRFVAGLTDLVAARQAGRPPSALSELGPWPGTCAVGCCSNGPADRDSVAGDEAAVAGPVTG